MDKICQNLFSVVKNAGERGFAALNKVIHESSTKVIAELANKVIPESCSLESQPCKTTKRLRLPTETFGNDGVCIKWLVWPNPAGCQTLGNDQTYKKRVRAAGFTLIELLVVILIVGILTSAALPQYRKAVIKSRVATGLVRVNALETAEKEFKLANGYYTGDLSLLSIDTGVWSCNRNEDSDQNFCQFLVPRTGILWELQFNAGVSYKVYCIAGGEDGVAAAVCKEYSNNCTEFSNGHTYCLLRQVK